MKDRSKVLKLRNRIRNVNRRLAKGAGVPSNADRSLWGEVAIVSFANVTGLQEDVRSDPETVLSDLLADLMHWCNFQRVNGPASEPVDFESALEQARDHYEEEDAGESGPKAGPSSRTTIVPI